MNNFLPDKFYAILDYNYIEEDKFYTIANNYLLSGVELIELKVLNKSDDFIRKIILKLLELKNVYAFSLILYDHIELVKEFQLDGVHLDKVTMSMKDAKEYLGECIIGKAVYSYDEAIKYYYEGADFLLMGPLFYSSSEKYMGHYNYIALEDVSRAVQNVSIPIVAFGGINLSNIVSVIETKVAAVTVVSNIFQDASPMEKVHSVISLFDGRYQKKKIVTINASDAITQTFSDFIQHQFKGIFNNEELLEENLKPIDGYDLVFYCISKERVEEMMPLELLCDELCIPRNKLVILTDMDSHEFRGIVRDYRSLALLYIEDQAQFHILSLIIESVIKK